MKAILIAAAACAAASAAWAQPAPQLAWRLDGLEAPESVALAADGTSLYVSNVGGDGDARDANGFIARVSLDGRLVQKAWAKDLNAPKGMALRANRLFVSDIDTLVELDADTGAAVNAWPIAAAQFLNDVAIGPAGEVLAADSGGARIYALKTERSGSGWRIRICARSTGCSPRRTGWSSPPCKGCCSPWTTARRR